MRVLLLCCLASACASVEGQGEAASRTLSPEDLEGWRRWARTVDWTDPEACGGHAGLEESPEMATFVKAVEGRWITIVVDKRYDDRPLQPGISLPIVWARAYKGDAVVREVLEEGRLLRTWHHNPVPGVRVLIGGAAWARPVRHWQSGNPPSLALGPVVVPDLKGQVVALAGRLVDIRVTQNPSRAPVRPGCPFAIYVDRTYKGDAIVQEVPGPGLVRARVFNPVAGTTIRIGDTASTHVPVRL